MTLPSKAFTGVSPRVRIAIDALGIVGVLALLSHMQKRRQKSSGYLNNKELVHTYYDKFRAPLYTKGVMQKRE